MLVLKSKKGYIHHPIGIGFIIGFILGLIIVYALNNSMIPGIGFKFC